MTRKTEFYAITPMGKYIKAYSLDELKESLEEQGEQKVEMYVVFMYDKPYIAQLGKGNKYWWPQINIIDVNGNPTKYQRGAFRVKWIFPDSGSYYFAGRKIQFENCITNEIEEITISGNKSVEYVTIDLFYTSLRDTLSKLNKEFCDKLIMSNK